MVIAQLVLDGKSYGLHNFIVPIRDSKTHKPLPGVTAGDIGPKLGFNVMDNGFARFSHVRIPRKNMAARYSSVDSSGKYHKHGSSASSKAAYLTMTQVSCAIAALH